MARVIALLALSFLLFCTYCFAQEATFGSTQSGLFSDPSVWMLIEGSDEDGIPDADDSLTINRGHQIEYLGHATSAIVHDMLIEAGGEFSITSPQPQTFWTTGKILVRGRFVINGPHELLFDGDESYLSGIHVVEGGELSISGVEVLHESVSGFSYLGDDRGEITLSLPSLESGALVGKRLKMLDGLAINNVYAILENSESSIKIDVRPNDSRATLDFSQTIEPIAIRRDRIEVERSLVEEVALPFRPSYAGGYVGNWLRFRVTGNVYLIIGVRLQGNKGIIYLEREVEGADLRNSAFQITSGISEGDSFVVYDPVELTIPETNRADGLGHSMLVVDKSSAELKYAKFSYFGSHIGDRRRTGGWKRSTGGLAFIDTTHLEIDFCEFYQTAAATQILIEGASDLVLTRNVVANAHPAINPTGELEVGHGWVFQHVDGLVFNQNIVMNMNDDLVYASRDVSDFEFTSNKLFNTPVFNGNSANSLEIVSTSVDARVLIEDNLMINADVNLSVEFRNGGVAEIYENLIASTLRWRSANVVLRNVNGSFSGNSLSHAPAGIVLMGDTNVNVRPNSYSHHYLSVIDRIDVQRNAWISLGVLALGFLLVSRARQRYFKWVVRAIYAGLVGVNLVTIYVSYFLM